MTEAAAAILAAAATAGIGQVMALTDPDNIASQAVAARLGMRDEGITNRWYGLTSRQYHKVITRRMAEVNQLSAARPRTPPRPR